MSFEFSPPRDDAAQRRLEKALLKLERLHPDFASVTYGALGSTKDKTHEIVEHIHHNTSMPVMPHLTCVGHTRAQIVDIVTDYRELGIENLLCLGGDPPVDGHPIAEDFHYASELIEAVRELGDFSIGVAAFPELHPRSPDRASDRHHLAAKLRAADFAITQFGWDVDDYSRMIDELAALGVHTPVIPSVMLFVNVDGFRRMSRVNNARIPAELDRALDLVSSPREVRDLAVEWGARLTSQLLERGVPGIHLYTMNASHATVDLYARLGLGPMSAGSS
jgi:methylenetetrahydrofolate reductase (NADPH)